MPEIVYILTNSRMDDFVKNGRTKYPRECMVQLSYATGVPVLFECYCACEVSNAADGKILSAKLVRSGLASTYL